MKWFLDAIKYNCSMYQYMYKGKKKESFFFNFKLMLHVLTAQNLLSRNFLFLIKEKMLELLFWFEAEIGKKKLQIIPNYHFRKDCPNRLWWGQKRRIWGWASWRVPTGWGRMQDTNNHPTTILSGDQWCCDHYSEGRRRWKSRWDWNYNCRFKDEHSYGIKYMLGRRRVHYSRMQREDN